MASDDEILSKPSSQKTSPVDMYGTTGGKISRDILSQVAVRRCPQANCPEKIVLCLDLSSEMDTVIFKSRSGDKFAPLKIIKRAISIFVWSKHRIDTRHEFAIVVMSDSALWVLDFTNSPREVVQFLEGINNSFGECGERYDLAQILEQAVQKMIKLPPVDPDVAPPFVLRFVIFYGRSHCLPEIGNKDAYDLIRALPYSFIDVFYIHEPPSENNKCKQVFDRLCMLDEDGLSYIFEVSKNLTKVYDYIAQLVAHPLQRPLQRDANYKLTSFDC